MTPLDKARAGIRVTTIDKLRTIATLEELQGFVDQVRRGGDLTREEWEMVARMKAELQQQAIVSRHGEAKKKTGSHRRSP